eukprot:gb/GFBE01003763.1/.p1 GENE.gb/GFBE01003763.1/~~gb/GFBE01003763.1/.p1  ORF type:complete len:258 (+),score=49.99 gb/GFBE01003763.1/:1-774(+)
MPVTSALGLPGILAEAPLPPEKLHSHWDSLRQRCVRRLGWSNDRVEVVLKEYKRFIELRLALKDFSAERLSPPLPIDEMWHLHVLDTKGYAAFCSRVCPRGEFLHHDADGDEDQAARGRRAFAATVAYQARFEEEPPPAVWYFEQLGAGPSQPPLKRLKTAASQLSEMDIYIRIMYLRTITMKVNSDTCVADVCRMIEEKEDIAIKQQRILFAGRQLNCNVDCEEHAVGEHQQDLLLSELGVHKEATLHLVLRLRGC